LVEAKHVEEDPDIQKAISKRIKDIENKKRSKLLDKTSSELLFLVTSFLFSPVFLVSTEGFRFKFWVSKCYANSSERGNTWL